MDHPNTRLENRLITYDISKSELKPWISWVYDDTEVVWRSEWPETAELLGGSGWQS